MIIIWKGFIKQPDINQGPTFLSFSFLLKPVEPPQIFAKVDLFPIDNDSEKKKVAKKYKPSQIPRKLLVTLLLSTSSNGQN